MDLSTASIIEKNKVSTNGVWLLLCKIQYKEETPVCLVCNNENIVFQGVTYYAYPFDISVIKRSSTELPDVSMTVSNVTGTIQGILEQYDGVSGADVTITAINTNIPDEVLDEEHFKVTGSSSDRQNVTLKLGAGFSLSKRFPCERVLKDFCQKRFKGLECGYNGNETSCDHTLSCCRRLGNNTRFGGAPTVPQGGLYVRN